MCSIGFVGLGDMGGPIASHLVDAGHDVKAYDVRDSAVEAIVDAGAEGASEAADVAEDTDVVLLSLPGPDAVESVVDEIATVLSPGSVVVDLSTSLPGLTDEIADRLDDSGVEVLGAPVSGGRAGAREATLTVMVGGDPDVVDTCRPFLSAFSNRTFHVGRRPGHGHAVKLLNNFLSFTGLLAACEALVLGELVGLEPGVMLDVFNASSGRNSATESKLPEQVLTGEFDMGFALGLAEKDVRLFTEFGAEHDTVLLVGPLVRGLYGYARSDLGADSDTTRVYQFVERMMTGDRE